MPEQEEQQGLEPGIHEGRSMDTYLSDPATSASQALAFHTLATPAHFRAKQDEDSDSSSKAQDLGNAAHDLILEPDSFAERNIREPALPDGYKNPRATKAYKESVEALAVDHPGARVLTTDQWEAVHAMRDNVRGLGKAAALLDAEGPVEVICIWDDPDTGLRLRIRPDKIARVPLEGGEIVTCVDLKTTRDASIDGFQRQIDKLGYAFKAAFYRVVLEGLGIGWDDHVCITAENFSPYLAACRGIHPDWIDMETPNVRAALRGIAACQASGRWPGYPNEIEYVNAPEWKLKQVSDIDFLDFGEEAA